METSKCIVFKNSNIFYTDYGTGKTVVLIHGFGEDGKVWNYLADNLKGNYRIIIPDLPGSGKSDMLNQESAPVSIDDYAEVIISIVKNESLDKCTILGHSMGGYIALAIAEKHPEILIGFGLINSTAFCDSEEKKKDRIKTIQFLQDNSAISFLVTSIPGLFADKFKQQHAEEVDELIDSTKYFTSKALIEYTAAMMNRPEKINLLKSTCLPVLFIVGEKDPVILLQKSLEQCHLPVTSFVHILPEVGHMAMIEEKKLSAAIITSYLDNL